MKKYFLHLNNETIGPFALEELKANHLNLVDCGNPQRGYRGLFKYTTNSIGKEIEYIKAYSEM
jgi:hypothetical protein